MKKTDMLLANAGNIVFYVLGAMAITALIVALISNAEAKERSIMIEFGFGFGNSAAIKRAKDRKVMACKELQADRLSIVAIRVRNDDAEVHVARFWGDTSHKQCDRSSYAIGIGKVFETDNDSYVSVTPGVAYTFGDRKTYTGQHVARSNWRLEDAFQIFGRAAVGVRSNSSKIEFAATQYGLLKDHHSESFLTVAIGSIDAPDKPVEHIHPGKVTKDKHTKIIKTNHKHVKTVQHKHTKKVCDKVHLHKKGHKHRHYKKVTYKEWHKVKTNHVHTKTVEYKDEHKAPDIIHLH